MLCEIWLLQMCVFPSLAIVYPITISLIFNIQDGPASVIQRKPKLTLTRPKEPEFETAQRVRSVKIKSSAEIEEEMMAKIPKFKARPLNKKVFLLRNYL